MGDIGKASLDEGSGFLTLRAHVNHLGSFENCWGLGSTPDQLHQTLWGLGPDIDIFFFKSSQMILIYSETGSH